MRECFAGVYLHDGVAAAQIAIELDRNPSFEAAIDMVPDCTPLGRKSLRTPLRSVLSLLVKLPVGKLANLVPLVRWMAVPPREDRLTPEVDHEKLREAFEKSTDTPVSRWLSELAFFINHDPFPPGLLSFVRFAGFVDATLDDDTLDNDYAFSVWAPAFGGKLARYPVRAAHTATLEAPREYREVYQKILDDISRV